MLIPISQWKASDNPSEEHDIADLAKELKNFNDEQLFDLAEEQDEGPKDARMHSSDVESGSIDDSDIEFDAHGINHGDLFCNTKGGAQIAQGDDNFDEEMGGESQIVEVATKIACEEIESEGDEEEEIEEYKVAPTAYVPSKSDGLTYPSPTRTDLADDDLKCLSKADDTFGRASSCGSEGDDDIVVVSSPCPVKSFANHREHALKDDTWTDYAEETLQRQGNDRAPSPPDCIPAKSSNDTNDEMSPNGSTCSHEGLRTQLTETPLMSTPKKQKSVTSKVSLMGSVFETSKADGPAKKSGGLYIPSYSRK